VFGFWDPPPPALAAPPADSALTLAETVQLLSTFDAETGEQRLWRGNDGSPYAATSAAGLIDLLFAGSITVTLQPERPINGGEVVPTAVAPTHPGLHRGWEFVRSQRKVRAPYWYVPSLERWVDSTQTLRLRGLAIAAPTSRQKRRLALTDQGLVTANTLRSDFSGERGAALAALIHRGRLDRQVFRDDWHAHQSVVLERALGVDPALRFILDPLGSHSAPSFG
jgi:hypothetical protein